MTSVGRAYFAQQYPGLDIPEADFAGLERQARRFVDYCTFNRIDEDRLSLSVVDDIKDAVCALMAYSFTEAQDKADQMADRRVSSETVGGHTVSYKYGDEIANRYRQAYEKDGQSELYKIVKVYLGHTGLMYRGVV